MLIGSMVAFGLLVVAWMLLPISGVEEREEVLSLDAVQRTEVAFQ